MPLHNIHEAKSQLSKLIEQAELGEDVVIAKSGKPVAKLIPYRSIPGSGKSGQFVGQDKTDINDLSPDISEHIKEMRILENELLEIGKRNAARKILDARSANEILGYDNDGLASG